MHQFRVVDVDHECRRVAADLGAVEHLQLPPGMRWMGMRILGIMDDRVDLGRCQPGEALLLDAQRHRQDLVDALAGLG